MPGLLRSTAGRLAVGTLGLAAALVVLGLILLWPRAGEGARRSGVATEVARAEVVSVSTQGCERFAGPGCRLAELRLLEGPRERRRSFLTLPGDPLAPPVQAGDRIRVARNAPEGEAAPDLEDAAAQPWAFQDFERGAPLAWLAAAFAALVVAFARWQGLRSLLGLALSLVVVVAFLVPAALEGRSPLLVALVGGLAVTLLTTGLTHGVGLKTVAALLGLTGALVLTAVLAVVAVEVAHVTGLASEEAGLLAYTTRDPVSLQGLVIAGVVIGALGVLDDVAISQASTVLALRRANPALRASELFAAAMAVGRDHLGATVNTLVLAYAGASLPALLIFANQGTALVDAVNREPVAGAIVAAVVGSLGLLAAVPLCTGLAALLATRVGAGALGEDAPAHAH